jgi:hypothetical protein
MPHNKLRPPQGRLEPRAALHLAPQMRLETQRLSALELGAKLRDTMLSSPPGPHRLGAIPDTSADAAAPADYASLEESKRPHLSAAGRAKEEAPTATIWKFLQAQADLDFDVSEANGGPRHVGRNDSARSQPRDANTWQIILKDPWHRYLGTADAAENASDGRFSRVFNAPGKPKPPRSCFRTFPRVFCNFDDGS